MVLFVSLVKSSHSSFYASCAENSDCYVDSETCATVSVTENYSEISAKLCVPEDECGSSFTLSGQTLKVTCQGSYSMLEYLVMAIVLVILAIATAFFSMMYG